jgi:hypothetical protein
MRNQRDATSGLEVSSAEFRYSTDGAASWSSWIAATCSGSDGTTSYQTVTAVSVPLTDSATLNRVQFRIWDMAGHMGESDTYTITVDSGLTAGWRDFRPSGWSTDSSIITQETAQNTTSGLDPTTAEYNYRYGSSGAWEGWQDVESYTAGAETTDPVTLYADAIPYTGESQTAFQVQFHIENYASDDEHGPQRQGGQRPSQRQHRDQ